MKRMKAKSLLAPGCMNKRPERHHSLYPWPKLDCPPRASGARVLTPVRDKETGGSILLAGAVMPRRRGYVMGLKDEAKDHLPPEIAWTGESFTRDGAGMYQIHTDAGTTTYAHESELREAA